MSRWNTCCTDALNHACSSSLAGVIIRVAGGTAARQGFNDGTERDSYQGYAIAAGYFLSTAVEDYAVSVPKSENYFGRVRPYYHSQSTLASVTYVISYGSSKFTGQLRNKKPGPCFLVFMFTYDAQRTWLPKYTHYGSCTSIVLRRKECIHCRQYLARLNCLWGFSCDEFCYHNGGSNSH